MAILLVSAVLLLVTVAAFKTAPLVGKLGLAAGIVLLVSSVFQLLAFALMIADIADCETAAPGRCCHCVDESV